MLNAYFVSDVHLGSLKDQRAQLFLSFLQSLHGSESPAEQGAAVVSANCSHLFLMGDIFDMWIGRHKYYIKKYAHIVTEVRRLKQQGVEIHYFEGNHDLYLKQFWGKELKINIHTGPAYFHLGGQILRVEHGDEMDPSDKGYLFLRWFLRTPFMKVLSILLPGFIVQRIGEVSSRNSRAYTTEKKSITDERAVQVIREHAQKVYRERPFDIIFSGHVHVSDEYEFYPDTVDGQSSLGNQSLTGAKAIKSLNLGTWLRKPCYYYLQEHGGQLIKL